VTPAKAVKVSGVTLIEPLAALQPGFNSVRKITIKHSPRQTAKGYGQPAGGLGI
jgi:hypothetical protein